MFTFTNFNSGGRFLRLRLKEDMNLDCETSLLCDLGNMAYENVCELATS